MLAELDRFPASCPCCTGQPALLIETEPDAWLPEWRVVFAHDLWCTTRRSGRPRPALTLITTTPERTDQ